VEPNPGGGSLLDEIAQDGAQRMLAEVAAYIERIVVRWMATDAGW